MKLIRLFSRHGGSIYVSRSAAAGTSITGNVRAHDATRPTDAGALMYETFRGKISLGPAKRTLQSSALSPPCRIITNPKLLTTVVARSERFAPPKAHEFHEKLQYFSLLPKFMKVQGGFAAVSNIGGRKGRIHHLATLTTRRA
ncbi:hypothetical protein EVAR_51271_1 [Eumeta japonica]|uniref:Uncharacterized protein n=1 Tax=Eumeta variegata TaxID=151549 RepID=A0A4C1YAV6_EUMVA|nr:hypothetical protein EVAR_51271_1 [Eumeta japonica]